MFILTVWACLAAQDPASVAPDCDHYKASVVFATERECEFVARQTPIIETPKGVLLVLAHKCVKVEEA